MKSLAELLEPIKVQLRDILLDPNNPRFAELGEEIDIVPENRYQEPKVQKTTFERMKNFDVIELRDTIRTLGFLPMDRIVVRRWKGVAENSNYVVIEGNRRIAALKWLIELHEAGKETFTDKQIENFTGLEALLLDEDLAHSSSKWILPGLRHVSGIKEWGPYQKARAVFVLRDSGISPQETAQSLGLSTRSANQLWRSYLALEQMKQDEEYGEYAEPRKYSYFEEVLKRPNVREWLCWNDERREFINKEKIKEFYSWIVGEISEEGEPAEPKLPEARSVRDLDKIINDNMALNVFKASGGSLTRALAKYESEHPEDWHPAINNACLVLASMTPDSLRKMTSDDVKMLEQLNGRINLALTDRQKLTK